MKTLSPPLKWHGGKHYLASRLVAMMPEHTHYVEPYFGGGAVLLAKDPQGVSEVVNDINWNLTNLWRVLANEQHFVRFARIVEATPFSEPDYRASVDNFDPSHPVESAVNFFIRCRQSLSGRMKDFATLSRNRTRRGMNEQVSAWLTAIDGLPDVHARLKRVVILNHDAVAVIKQQDGAKTLFYLDPPYLHETRATTGEYEHEMTLGQHEELLATLGGVDGKFMLSGYESELYSDAANANGWSCHKFELPNNSAGGKSKRRMVECVWCNFDVDDSQSGCTKGTQ